MAQVVTELEPRLCGGQLQKVRQPDRETLALTVRVPGRTTHCILCCRPGVARIAESASPTTTIESPTALGAWLRRYAKGRRVESVTLDPKDRVVVIQLHGGRLILEIVGRAANLYAVATDGRVVASARPPRSGLSLGQPYVELSGGVEERALGSSRFENAEAVERHFQETLERLSLEQGVREKRRLITSAGKRLRRLEEKIRADLERCHGADALRMQGELLKGQLHRVVPKSDSVEVDDWYSEGMPKVTIELDPRLDGPGNVERLFKRYRRARDGAQKARERQVQVEALRTRFDALESEALDFDELRQALLTLGLCRRTSNTPRGPATSRLPFHEFLSRKGERILVGRGGRDNHQTTFHHARGNDHWLHVRDSPGAHVIVPCPSRGADPHPETLLDAAALAVHHSKLRGEAGVAVSHTLRKHLRPIKGGAPGQVTIAGAATLICADVDVRIERLYAERSR